MKKIDENYTVDEKQVFSLIRNVKESSEKPSVQFHYQIEDIEKNSHPFIKVGRENSFFYIEEK